jgi:hypothetical protein
VNEVCRMLSVDPDDLHKKGRANDLSSGKGLICYLGTTNLASTGRNWSGIEIQDSLLVRDLPNLLHELLQPQQGTCVC